MLGLWPLNLKRKFLALPKIEKEAPNIKNPVLLFDKSNKKKKAKSKFWFDKFSLKLK